MPASTTLLQAVMVTAELCGYPFTSETVATVFIEDLAGYPESQVLAALKRCRLAHTGRLTVADVLSRLEDGRPGVETAWAQVATRTDERKSLAWCEEMRVAWATALPLLNAGDAIAARMAFKEEYTRLLTAARRERTPPQWSLTLGSDPDQREQVVTAAAAQGLITAAHAVTLLPYHPPPTPASQALLEAVAAAIRLPAPDTPRRPAPAVPVADRLAALRAAVMGAPVWSPPPKGSPRPARSATESWRRQAEAGSSSPPPREPALAGAEEPV